jgi:hypothetical protein
MQIQARENEHKSGTGYRQSRNSVRIAVAPAETDPSATAILHPAAALATQATETCEIQVDE